MALLGDDIFTRRIADTLSNLPMRTSPTGTDFMRTPGIAPTAGGGRIPIPSRVGGEGRFPVMLPAGSTGRRFPAGDVGGSQPTTMPFLQQLLESIRNRPVMGQQPGQARGTISGRAGQQQPAFDIRALTNAANTLFGGGGRGFGGLMLGGTGSEQQLARMGGAARQLEAAGLSSGGFFGGAVGGRGGGPTGGGGRLAGVVQNRGDVAGTIQQMLGMGPGGGGPAGPLMQASFEGANRAQELQQENLGNIIQLMAESGGLLGQNPDIQAALSRFRGIAAQPDVLSPAQQATLRGRVTEDTRGALQRIMEQIGGQAAATGMIGGQPRAMTDQALAELLGQEQRTLADIDIGFAEQRRGNELDAIQRLIELSGGVTGQQSQAEQMLAQILGQQEFEAPDISGILSNLGLEEEEFRQLLPLFVEQIRRGPAQPVGIGTETFRDLFPIT